jgi:hypothetical protein
VLKPTKTKEEYELEKLALENKKLAYEISFVGRWSKTITTITAIVVSSITILSGLSEYRKSIEDRVMLRQQQERTRLAECFTLLSSKSETDVAQGSAGLLRLLKANVNRSDIFDGLKLYLSALNDDRRLSVATFFPGGSENPVSTYDPIPQVQPDLPYKIKLLIPVFEVYSASEKNELYEIIFNNHALKSDRLVALVNMSPNRQNWETVLSDADDYVRFGGLALLANRSDPFVDDLLIRTLSVDNMAKNYVMVYISAHALGLRKSQQAVPALLKLLSGEPWGGIQFRVYEALGNIGDSRALPALQRQRDEWERPGRLNTFDTNALERAIAALSKKER